MNSWRHVVGLSEWRRSLRLQRTLRSMCRGFGSIWHRLSVQWYSQTVHCLWASWVVPQNRFGWVVKSRCWLPTSFTVPLHALYVNQRLFKCSSQQWCCGLKSRHTRKLQFSNWHCKFLTKFQQSDANFGRRRLWVLSILIFLNFFKMDVYQPQI